MPNCAVTENEGETLFSLEYTFLMDNFQMNKKPIKMKGNICQR